MKTYVVFQGGVERVSLPNNEGQGPTCYEQQAKLKQTKKFLQRKSKLKVCKTEKKQNVAEPVKTDQQVVNNFFGALLQLKSKNSEHTPEIQLYRAYCQKNSYQKDDLVIYGEFFRQADRICFWTACHNF